MSEILIDSLPAIDAHPGNGYQSVNGTYVGQHGPHRLELRVDLAYHAHDLYQALGLLSGDLFRDVGSGEWDHRLSFIVEQPSVRWGPEKVFIAGSMAYHPNDAPAFDAYTAQPGDTLEITLPLSMDGEPSQPATVHVARQGSEGTTFACEKTSPFLRCIELEIDRITGTQLPRPFQTHAAPDRPLDLGNLDLDISHAYRRAGIDMRVIDDGEVFSAHLAGDDLKWDEDELHNAMEHHFALWRDEPQWKLYLLIATHYTLYPDCTVTGIMYDSQYRDPNDPHPRQGAAVFYSSMLSQWAGVSPAEFDRNYMRTCVHELGHALNLLHTFDRDRPESLSWMNYPWRYPYGYNLPPGWNGTEDFWRQCRFEFDGEELRHLRHGARPEVIPGGVGFGPSALDLPTFSPTSPQVQQSAPLALYIRTRPERYLFDFAEPVSIELKLANQSKEPVWVPDMLNPEMGLLELYIRDPKGRVRPYQPLFKLCGEPRMAELPPGGRLYESVFVAYGAKGFGFEEPGEYQLWAVYGAGGGRLRSNLLRIRVAYPRTREDEEMALWTFGRDQGHVLYMRGAAHLQVGNDRLREVTERFPDTNLARYIHYCFGNSQARPFKDLTANRIRPPWPEAAARELEKARAFAPRREMHSALDNITHGRAVNMLSDLYLQMDQGEKARTVLTQTARYFTRMSVKSDVIDGMRQRVMDIHVT